MQEIRKIKEIIATVSLFILLMILSGCFIDPKISAKVLIIGLFL